MTYHTTMSAWKMPPSWQWTGHSNRPLSDRTVLGKRLSD